MTRRNLVLWGMWIALITITAGLPRGTLPNSVEPWIGPLPFSLVWIVLLYFAGWVLLWLSFQEVTHVMGIRTPDEERVVGEGEERS